MIYIDLFEMFDLFKNTSSVASNKNQLNFKVIKIDLNLRKKTFMKERKIQKFITMHE